MSSSPPPPSSEITETNTRVKYKGVRKRTWGKYVSEIRLPNSRERIWLGSYDSAIKAARAFDAALFCLRGSSASFNFPDNPPDIPGGRFLNAAEIQIAASRFANCDPNPVDSSGSEMQPPETESSAMVPPAYLDNGSVWNEFSFMGSSGNNIPATDPFHSNVFPEFDDFSNGYFNIPPPAPEESDYMEENNGGLILWNF
ncbi:ethylene-responsive transcription factor ERF017-like [Impatiens glandulifera]|uniref:ethylene-responsive transcription factor ERF017-like n=1 Tax=Impatiens glandulifera TaxID=253017 RepID=UPI001FB0E021|nr:ethylene-responsive transcription factor ERF017-like [Impatiens glandulifera]